MFSGGRDSTLAAIRLAEAGTPITLVTITSSHLAGISRVLTRLRELADYLPTSTRWMQVVQPTELRTDTSFYAQTCLSCHHAYVVACAAIARQLAAREVVFGYVGYQSHWPEQTRLAIDALRETLTRHGFSLSLPVYDIADRETAISELTRRGLSADSLEQKCLRQVTNIELAPALLVEQVSKWQMAIDHSMSALAEIKVHVETEIALGALAKELS